MAKTYVSSTVYNLAGSIEDRPNYLKTLVVSSVLTDKNFSLGTTLNSGYLYGPGMKLRSFFRWAQDNYSTTIGQLSTTLAHSVTVDQSATQAAIPHGPDETAVVLETWTGGAELETWARQFILENYPDRIDEAWTVSLLNPLAQITWPDASTETFMPWWYEQLGYYLYARYQYKYGYEEGPIVAGPVITLGSTDDYPDVTGYTMDEDSEVTHPVTLDTTITTTVSYSDGRPDEVTTDTSSDSTGYTNSHKRFVKETYEGQDPVTTVDRLYSTKTYQSRDETGAVEEVTSTETSSEVIAGGVTKTTTVVTVEDTIVMTRKYHIDTQDITEKAWSTEKIFIYKFGTGNASLDAMVGEAIDDEGYFPFIPVRANNNWVDENPDLTSDIPPLVKKAYKKALGGKWSDIVDMMSDNEDLDEMDWIYVVFGVSLNTKENTGRQYAYKLLKRCMDTVGSNSAALALHEAENAVAVVAKANWDIWKLAQSNPSDPLYNTPEPPLYPLLYAPEQQIWIRQITQPQLLYDIRITWNELTEDSGTGLAKPDAKAGDLWFEKGGTVPYEITYLWWQLTDNSWKRITAKGLTSRNYIWQDNNVMITAHEALDDDEESGFLFPLHFPTYKDMGLIDGTQLSTSCVYLLINTLKIVKKKWYQTGFFKLFIIIVAIVISVYTGGLGGAGILGSNIGVGAALGFTGVTASIVGGIANAFAAMLLVKLIGVFSTAVFGDKIGAIVTLIASVVALNVGTNLMNGGSLSLSMGQMMRADNILKLTNAAGRGFADYIQASLQDDIQKTQDKLETINDQITQINDLYARNIGYDRGQFDPMALLDMSSPLTIETGDTFLTRTLMTGSDVAELSLSLLTNFADLTLSTDLAN